MTCKSVAGSKSALGSWHWPDRRRIWSWNSRTRIDELKKQINQPGTFWWKPTHERDVSSCHVVNFDLRGFCAVSGASIRRWCRRRCGVWNKLRARKRRKGISTSVMPSRAFDGGGEGSRDRARARTCFRSKPVRVRSSRPLKLLMLMTCVQPARRTGARAGFLNGCSAASFTLVSKQVSKRRQVKMGEMPMLEGRDA